MTANSYVRKCTADEWNSGVEYVCELASVFPGSGYDSRELLFRCNEVMIVMQCIFHVTAVIEADNMIHTCNGCYIDIIMNMMPLR